MSELPISSASLKERLTTAIYHFQSLTRDTSSLIQIWMPLNKGINNFLTTADHPYSYHPASSSLANYRRLSENYKFSADQGSKEDLSLPGRVFLARAPEWTPDVQLFSQDEYPRLNHAQMCHIRGSIALPVFHNDSLLAVLEIVTTAQKITYRTEALAVCTALQSVGLTTSQIDRNAPHTQAAVHSEILHIIRTVCEKHGLPLGQTWAPYTQQRRDWHSGKHTRASIIDSACCLNDQRISGFHEACLEQQLLGGQGVVGKALMTNLPCYAIDVTACRKAEYPLCHHAKIFGLGGAVAIHLQHLYGACESYVLEFFLPTDCQEPGLTFHCKIMDSLTTMVQGSSSFCFLSGKETQQDTTFTGKELSFYSEGKEDESQKVSFEFGKDLREEFKVTTQWSDTHAELQRGQILDENPDLAGSSFGSDLPLGAQKAGKKRKTKSQKTISFQVLRQYFAGSLKDAAKSMGVCPTTLKRICRQYGINRWPSRKIKKVDHSLRKLQHVIDSFQGTKTSIPLSSFYSDFPQLSPTAAKNNDQSHGLNVVPENTSSEESSFETTSSSQTSSSTGGLTSNACGSGDTSTSQDPTRPPKRARLEEDLPLLYHKSPVILERSRSQRDGVLCKVKATFREEMIRLTVTPFTGFGDLQCEIARRFNIGDISKMYIKYLDDDKEWVLLTCDDDLEECIDIQRSSGSHTVKLSVHEISSGDS